MKNITKRSVSIVLSLILCFSVVFGFNFSAEAATVDYVKSGNYIYNWGVREEVATFLSPNAEAFYTKNNTSYAKLSALSGSATESAVPSSALYKELQNLMQKNHSNVTSYNETRDKFQYTDCQNSGKTSKKISSFYSGKDIGPSWDSGNTWNREHCWPNSKSNSGSKTNTKRETDIMMLRPTATSENGSRGNKAYGKGGSYYNPNSESGGKHDLRGDVARIVLYVYVRWGGDSSYHDGALNYMWGSSGVIESRAVLLEWMEADPVDTWELGRNDSVQSITGTRNVFVDYPELAFIMLGADVPTDYTTPSGEAKKGTSTPNPNPGTNNNSSNTQSGNTSSNTSNNNTSSNTTSKPNNNTSSNTSSKPSNNTSNNTASSNNTSSNTTSNSTTSTPVDTNCKHKNTQTVAAEDARCDVEGFTEGEYCLDCKSYISGREVIAPLEHSYGDDDVCTNCGDKKETVTDDETTEDTTTIGAIENNDDLTTTDDESSGIGTVGWILIVVAVLVVAGGTVFVIMYFTKKNAKEE